METETESLSPADETETRGRMAYSRWLLGEDDDGGKVYAELTTMHHGRPSYEYVATLNVVTVKTDGPFTTKSFGLFDGVRMRLRVPAKRFGAKGLGEAHQGHVSEVHERYDLGDAGIRARFTR